MDGQRVPLGETRQDLPAEGLFNVATIVIH